MADRRCYDATPTQTAGKTCCTRGFPGCGHFPGVWVSRDEGSESKQGRMLGRKQHSRACDDAWKATPDEWKSAVRARVQSQQEPSSQPRPSSSAAQAAARQKAEEKARSIAEAKARRLVKEQARLAAAEQKRLAKEEARRHKTKPGSRAKRKHPPGPEAALLEAALQAALRVASAAASSAAQHAAATAATSRPSTTLTRASATGMANDPDVRMRSPRKPRPKFCIKKFGRRKV